MRRVVGYSIFYYYLLCISLLFALCLEKCVACTNQLSMQFGSFVFWTTVLLSDYLCSSHLFDFFCRSSNKLNWQFFRKKKISEKFIKTKVSSEHIWEIISIYKKLSDKVIRTCANWNYNKTQEIDVIINKWYNNRKELCKFLILFIL